MSRSSAAFESPALMAASITVASLMSFTPESDEHSPSTCRAPLAFLSSMQAANKVVPSCENLLNCVIQSILHWAAVLPKSCQLDRRLSTKRLLSGVNSHRRGRQYPKMRRVLELAP